MNHHVLIIHGIGKTKAGYSQPLSHGIQRALSDRRVGISNQSTLIFHEILWDDVVALEQARLADVLRKGFGLAAREVAVNILERIFLWPKHLINSLRTDAAAGGCIRRLVQCVRQRRPDRISP